jgi:hypothetical protein
MRVSSVIGRDTIRAYRASVCGALVVTLASPRKE